MDLINQKFTAQSVAIAAGCSTKQLNDWCNMGLVIGQREPLGRGHKRSFSWFNVMEIAGAMALMDVGVTSPGDAFRISARFSHGGNGGMSWVGDDALTDSDPMRHPGLPYHHAHGETYLLVAAGKGSIVLSTDGTVSASQVLQAGPAPIGFVALNLSNLFFTVVRRLGLGDSRLILDAAYADHSEA